MNIPKKTLVILMADDDADDRLLAQDAMHESRVLNELYFVEDGVQLLRYLRGEGEFAERATVGIQSPAGYAEGRPLHSSWSI